MFITDVLIEHSAAVAKASGASAIFVLSKTVTETQIEQLKTGFAGTVIHVVPGGQMEPLGDSPLLRIPDVPLTRLSQVKLVVFLALSQNLINVGDIAVFLAGAASSNLLDMLFIAQVGRETEAFYIEGTDALPKNLRPEVMNKVIELAVQIGHEGREGKPVGALFVAGDADRVMSMSRQLVLNPFRGYAAEERNLLDPLLEETVKEFSAIDGAFVVRGDGLIEACGVFLKTSSGDEKLPPGLGARHHVAAGITAVTDSVAVSVSQSNGTVTIFRGGRIVSKFERSRNSGATPR